MQPQSGTHPLTVKLSREREYVNQIVALQQVNREDQLPPRRTGAGRLRNGKASIPLNFYGKSAGATGIR